MRGGGRIARSLILAATAGWTAACGGAPIRQRPPTEAQALFLAGDYRGALAEYRGAARTPTAELLAAACKLKLDRATEAVADLRRLAAADRDPELSTRILLTLAEAHALAGDPIESLRAAEAAEQAERKHPGRAPRDELLFVTGCAYLRLGRLDEGKRRLQELVDSHPRSGLSALAALRMQVDGFGVRVGEEVRQDAAPEAGGLPVRLVRIELEGRTQVFALMDGLASFGQAHSLAGRLRRDGLIAEVLP